MLRKTTLAAGAAILAFAASPALAQDSLGEWDLDRDERLMPDEFSTGFEESGMLDDLDRGADEAPTIEEFSDSLFDGYDANEDGYLDQFEMEAFETDMEDGLDFDLDDGL